MAEFSRELIRVDKNGSKHFMVTHTCPKCGGTGTFYYTYFNACGRCFKCDGRGKVTEEIVERTKEYQAKLDAKRIARQEKIRLEEEEKEKNLQEEVFPEGKVYIALGDTYSIKEEIKAHNGKYDANNGWYFATAKDAEDFKTLTVDVADVKPDIKVTSKGYWVTMEAVEKPKEESKSQYIGNVGDKVELEATFVRVFSYDSRFGTVYVNKFQQGDNVIIWKTGKEFYVPEEEAEKEIKVVIKGTVKEHSEYNEEKQTLLTRCKVTAINSDAHMW